MGIPSYFSHIVKKHRSILKKYDSYAVSIDNLYLDSNSIIYDCIQLISYKNDQDFENTLIKKICEKIESYINIIKPKQRVLIAFDGVAPVAKLSQQKNRRYKSWFQNTIIQDINDRHNINNVKRWDSAAITPGTEFMNNLNENIRRYFLDFKKYNIEEIIVSGSDIPGEGEHKIYEYIRNNSAYHNDTITVIYGLDADLIMLTLNHLKYCNNMFLFRETPHFISHIDNTLIANQNYMLDIPEFADMLIYEMTNISPESEIKISQEVENNIIQDYIFMCFFLGNDFMPHFPALNIRTNGINHLMNAYNSLNSTNNTNNTNTQYIPKHNLINNNKIVWKNVRKLLELLSETEHANILDEYKIKDKMEKRNMPVYNAKQEEDKFISIPIYERGVEKYINPREDYWEYRYYKALFNTEFNFEEENIDIEKLRQISVNYLETLEWTFKYYNEGCIDWRHYYKYDYPPLIKDLAIFVPHFDTDFLQVKEKDPIDKYIQLCYVLPRLSLNLLPKELFQILIENYSEYYRLDYKFQWAYCRYFWECHVLMPHIDLNVLEKIVKRYTSSYNYKKLVL